MNPDGVGTLPTPPRRRHPGRGRRHPVVTLSALWLHRPEAG